MGWLRLAGSLQLYVSSAEYSPFYTALLQKRIIILRSLIIVATPYRCWCVYIELLWSWLELRDIFVLLTYALGYFFGPFRIVVGVCTYRITIQLTSENWMIFFVLWTLCFWLLFCVVNVYIYNYSLLILAFSFSFQCVYIQWLPRWLFRHEKTQLSFLNSFFLNSLFLTTLNSDE